MTHWCFHHDDLDGRCAAAIVRRRHPDVRCVEMDYGREPDLAAPQAGETLYIVDYVPEPVALRAWLARGCQVIWIDHHLTSIERAEFTAVPGLRTTDDAACVLTWRFLFPADPLPHAVRLVADKDTWTWRFGEETARFNEGMRLRDSAPTSAVWAALFAGDAALLETIGAEGAIGIRYRQAFSADYCRRFGFETLFEGHRAFAVGLSGYGSHVFGDRLSQCDLGICFEFDGRSWAISLYSTHVDVRAIAERHGGGGHPRAAGFTCASLPEALRQPVAWPRA